MSEQFIRYLEREHARLETLIAQQYARPHPDKIDIGRLKKAKLLVKDQLAHWQSDITDTLIA